MHLNFVPVCRCARILKTSRGVKSVLTSKQTKDAFQIVGQAMQSGTVT